MIIAPIPFWYRELTKRGEWRLSIGSLRRRVFAKRVDRFPEGTVYRLWLWVVQIRLMVKA
jgi:hypothetical protein